MRTKKQLESRILSIMSQVIAEKTFAVKEEQSDPLTVEYNSFDDNIRRARPFYLPNSEDTYNGIGKAANAVEALQKPIENQIAECKKSLTLLQQMQSKAQAANKPAGKYDDLLSQLKQNIQDLTETIKLYNDALTSIAPTLNAVDGLIGKLAYVTGMNGKRY